jgi:hypothetical protein
MTDWAQVREADYAVPSDRSLEELVAELVSMLRSPDPVVRDRQAYAVLATWIGRGVLTPTSYVLRDMEDDRLGYALAATLTRDDLTGSDAVDWLDPAIRALSNPPVEGITPEVTNTIRTLRVVYVLADHGLRVGDEKKLTPIPRREQVKTKLADVFRTVTPYYL